MTATKSKFITAYSWFILIITSLSFVLAEYAASSQKLQVNNFVRIIYLANILMAIGLIKRSNKARLWAFIVIPLGTCSALLLNLYVFIYNVQHLTSGLAIFYGFCLIIISANIFFVRALLIFRGEFTRTALPEILPYHKLNLSLMFIVILTAIAMIFWYGHVRFIKYYHLIGVLLPILLEKMLQLDSRIFVILYFIITTAFLYVIYRKERIRHWYIVHVGQFIFCCLWILFPLYHIHLMESHTDKTCIGIDSQITCKDIADTMPLNINFSKAQQFLINHNLFWIAEMPIIIDTQGTSLTINTEMRTFNNSYDYLFNLDSGKKVFTTNVNTPENIDPYEWEPLYWSWFRSVNIVPKNALKGEWQIKENTTSDQVKKICYSTMHDFAFWTKDYCYYRTPEQSEMQQSTSLFAINKVGGSIRKRGDIYTAGFYFTQEIKEPLYDAQISPLGLSTLVAYESGIVRHTILNSKEYKDYAIEFTQDDKLGYSLYGDWAYIIKKTKNCVIWNLYHNEQVDLSLSVNDIVIDGAGIAYLASEGEIKVYDLHNKKYLRSIPVNANKIYDLDLNVDDDKMAAATNTGIYIWNKTDNKIIAQYTKSEAYLITFTDFSEYQSIAVLKDNHFITLK